MSTAFLVKVPSMATMYMDTGLGAARTRTRPGAPVDISAAMESTAKYNPDTHQRHDEH